MKKLLAVMFAAVLVLGLGAGTAQANSITLTDSYGRIGILADTLHSGHPVSGSVGFGNLGASDIGTLLGGTWTELGACTGGNPCNNGVLTLNLTSGAWGTTTFAGTWALTSAYSNLAVSWHTGAPPSGGPGASAGGYFLWTLATGDGGGLHSGTFSYTGAAAGQGSGFSNFKVWGSVPTTVPDGGATLMLLGGALVGLGALRRKFRA